MRMIKTVKGKVITGATAFALISGGAVMASSDAGMNLKAWYDGKFGESSTKVATDSANYAKGKVPSLNREYNGLKSEGTDFINTAGTQKTAEGAGNINQAKAEHITAIQDKEAEIQGYMDSQFDALYASAQKIINDTANQGYKWAQNDLSRKYGADGAAATAKVESDLTKVKDAAVTDLETAIQNAKGNLLTSLNSNTTATTAEIKAAIDAKINVLRGEITDLRDNLVAVQKQVISDKAIALENQAKNEMDTLVADINN